MYAAQTIRSKGETTMTRRPKPALIQGAEFPSAREAIRHARASWRGKAILLGGKNLVVRPEDADRLAAAGVAFAYLCEHRGRVVTVPVND
jgi:hypothetical protein